MLITPNGRVVAITGASSGIGLATARHLASLGARVMLGARGADQLASVSAEIAAAGGDVAHAVVDVSDRADVARFVASAVERFGRLDVLVASAGAMPTGPMDELAVDDWELMIDVNLKGVVYGIAAALPIFRAQGSGHFVNVASTAARKTVPEQAVYSATKAAVLALSDGLRQELAGSLRVTVVSPGFTDTNVVEHVRDPGRRERMREAAARYAMDPVAVAKAIAYAIEQPDEIDVGEIVVRSTAQP